MDFECFFLVAAYISGFFGFFQRLCKVVLWFSWFFNGFLRCFLSGLACFGFVAEFRCSCFWSWSCWFGGFLGVAGFGWEVHGELGFLSWLFRLFHAKNVVEFKCCLVFWVVSGGNVAEFSSFTRFDYVFMGKIMSLVSLILAAPRSGA